MTPGFYSTPLWRHDLREAARLIGAAGFSDIEINGDDFGSKSVPHVRLPLTSEEARATADTVRGLGLTIPALSANRHLVSGGPAETKAAVVFVKAMIDVATAMGVPFVHTFTGRGPDGVSPGALRARFGDAVADITSHAASRGVRYGIEGCAPHLFTLTEDYLRLFADLPGVPVTVCFDPSHFQARGENPADAARALGDRIAHVHIKDAFGLFPDFSFPPLGEGQVEFPPLLQALRDVGYNGSLTVEYEAYAFGWDETEAHILAHSRSFLQSLGI